MSMAPLCCCYGCPPFTTGGFPQWLPLGSRCKSTHEFAKQTTAQLYMSQCSLSLPTRNIKTYTKHATYQNRKLLEAYCTTAKPSRLGLNSAGCIEEINYEE